MTDDGTIARESALPEICYSWRKATSGSILADRREGLVEAHPGREVPLDLLVEVKPQFGVELTFQAASTEQRSEVCRKRVYPAHRCLPIRSGARPSDRYGLRDAQERSSL